MTTSQILQGDALSVLKTLESGSVQCCITSPPYYGLRNYQTEPQIWDGDADCDHEWGETLPYAKQDTRTPEQKRSQGATVGNSVNSIGFAVGSSGQFCQLCGSWKGELGLEPTVQLFISHLTEIFREVKRVLKADGVCFVNLGDSYAGTGSKGDWVDPKYPNGRNGQSVSITQKVEGIRNKSLLNVPHRFAIAMTDELQMIQRNCVIWHKPSCMPSSAKDRFTVDFEPIFMFTKSPKYKFNQILENGIIPAGAKGAKASAERSSVNDVNSRPPEYHIYNGLRNKRCVWKIPFEPKSNEHYASYPTKLIEPMILAGSREGDTVLDPFNGTGTTGLVALRNNRNYIGIELNPEYIEISEERLKDVQVRMF